MDTLSYFSKLSKPLRLGPVICMIRAKVRSLCTKARQTYRSDLECVETRGTRLGDQTSPFNDLMQFPTAGPRGGVQFDLQRAEMGSRDDDARSLPSSPRALNSAVSGHLSAQHRTFCCGYTAQDDGPGACGPRRPRAGCVALPRGRQNARLVKGHCPHDERHRGP